MRALNASPNPAYKCISAVSDFASRSCASRVILSVSARYSSSSGRFPRLQASTIPYFTCEFAQ